MILAHITGMIAAALGGLAVGVVHGRRTGADDAQQAHSIQTRLAAFESAQHKDPGAFEANGAAAAAYQADAVGRLAGSIEKLAEAIEKQAAAIDDHGAAIVAAAIECRSGAMTLAPMAPEPKN
jgi:hypothetical protein